MQLKLKANIWARKLKYGLRAPKTIVAHQFTHGFVFKKSMYLEFIGFYFGGCFNLPRLKTIHVNLDKLQKKRFIFLSLKIFS